MTDQSASIAQVTSPPTGQQHDTIVVLDFGAQTSQLIARRVRESQVYCELLPFDVDAATLDRLNPRGFILSGGPASVYEPGAPQLSPAILERGVPILGICYGMQALTRALGGGVEPSTQREYGRTTMRQVDGPCALFDDLPETMQVWMSHGDRIERLPPGFRVVATSDNSPVAAMASDQGWIGIQFHPEVIHTPQGKQMLDNFVRRVCGCRGDWTAGSFIDEAVARIREQVGDGQVLCGLSGGVDSAVAAALIHRAVGDQLTCVFVDTGLLRLGEAEQVVETFQQHLGIRLVAVEASQRFLDALYEVIDPEEKRRRIGETFIRVFEGEAHKLGRIDFLAQGTLYPDVIESAHPERKTAHPIKTHHNVGGLPADLKFTLVEPLRYLFKDEVRQVGLALGLPEEMVYRHPFPGPGLAVRIVGEVTRTRLDTLRRADAIVTEEIKAAGVYRDLAQAFAVLTPVRSVGVMGDYRTYSNLLAIRAVTSEDYMTADWARLPYDLLGRMANRIVNEVPGINRVVYDISSKPPATIEWE